MKTSVVIPTLNRPESVLHLLDCLSQQSVLPDEVLIVEQGGKSVWEHQSKLNCCFPVRIIYEDIKSLTYARGRGVTYSVGEIIFFFDDDIILKPNYIKTAIEFFDANQSAQGVGGKYVDKDYSGPSFISNLVSRLMRIRGNGKRNKILPSGWGDFVRGDGIYNVTKADWLFGCNMVIRRSVFGYVQFETDMRAWSFLEDLFFGAQLTKTFGTCLYIHPELEVLHDAPGTSGKLSKETIRMRIIHRYIFWRDHVRTNFNGNIFSFISGLFMTFLLTSRGAGPLQALDENFKSWYFILNHKNMGWNDANSFIFSKN